MKRYALFLTILVLTLSLFTGCGCTPQGNSGQEAPTRTTNPIVPETNIPPTTMPSEEATTPDTMPSESENGNGGSDSSMAGGNGTDSGMTGGNGSGSGMTGGNGAGSGIGGGAGAAGATGDITDSTGPSDVAGRSRGMR